MEQGVKIPIRELQQNLNYENAPLMETIEPLEDIVNRPNHYHKGGIDVIKYMEMKFPKEQLVGFHRGNALKYLMRYQDKGGVEDLRKAEFYIKKLIELEAAADGT